MQMMTAAPRKWRDGGTRCHLCTCECMWNFFIVLLTHLLQICGICSFLLSDQTLESSLQEGSQAPETKIQIHFPDASANFPTTSTSCPPDSWSTGTIVDLEKSSKVKHAHTLHPMVPPLDTHPREMKTHVCTKTCPQMLLSAVFVI